MKLNKLFQMNHSKHVFLVGIGGAGMSTLARLLRHHGYQVCGSDREFDRGLRPDFYRSLQQAGIQLFPQDGSGITKNIHHVVSSTAIELKVPDLAAANSLHIPVIHRSKELAEQSHHYTSIAVAGTSGKTTVTGMIAWLFSKLNQDPTVLSGAPVPDLGKNNRDADFIGGSGNTLIFEADESDGSLVNYHPDIGLIHNISKDHKDMNELNRIFSQFSQQVSHHLLIDKNHLSNFKLPEVLQTAVIQYGFSNSADIQARDWSADAWTSSFRLDGFPIRLSVPGFHNAQNATAAYAVGKICDLDSQSMIQALQQFPGVRRRFELIGGVDEIAVVDDFAHNPDKIRATLKTASESAKRVIAIFQPHGFGPVKFMFQELVDVFCNYLGSEDQLILTPIFFAGGTVERTINSRDIAKKIHSQKPKLSIDVIDRPSIPGFLLNIIRPGDYVVVMGARDPSLSLFTRSIFDTIRKSRNP